MAWIKPRKSYDYPKQYEEKRILIGSEYKQLYQSRIFWSRTGIKAVT